MTQIKDSYEGDGPHTLITKEGGALVGLTVWCGGSLRGEAEMHTSEFLAAVAAECDVIVIPRTDLPEPNPEYTGVDPEGHRKLALWHLAQAEYLDARPPVDEAQVQALARLIGEDGQAACDIFRRLLATGRIEVRP